jgi:hypothetical protein
VCSSSLTIGVLLIFFPGVSCLRFFNAWGLESASLRGFPCF